MNTKVNAWYAVSPSFLRQGQGCIASKSIAGKRNRGDVNPALTLRRDHLQSPVI